MKVMDVMVRMPDDAFVTIVGSNGNTLVDCDTCDRICAFDKTDKYVHNILRNGTVYGIEVGKRGDIILSIY